MLNYFKYELGVNIINSSSTVYAREPKLTGGGKEKKINPDYLIHAVSSTTTEAQHVCARANQPITNCSRYSSPRGLISDVTCKTDQ